MSGENNKNTIADKNEISGFIKENKLATVCCTISDNPYCFNCFYSFLEEENCIVFKSTPGAKHCDILDKNNKVAGTIVSGKTDLSKLQGIQFEGIIFKESSIYKLKAAASYYFKFPFALAMPGELWVIELQSIKFTNHAKGFGHKSYWQKKAVKKDLSY